VLRSPEFASTHRVAPRDFTRKRCLSLDVLVAFLLQMIGGRSLQVGLDQFLGGFAGTSELARRVTKSALSQARKKLQPSAFAALSKLWVQRWSACAGEPLWRGFRVVAADGLCLQVPSWRETQLAYGLGPSKDGSVVVARLVGLFAVASRQMLHVQIGAYLDGERSLLVRCLQFLGAGDLLVLDRGYPAWWLFAWFSQHGISVCARLDPSGCGRTEIAQLLRSGNHDLIVEHKMNAKMLRQLVSAGGQHQEKLTVRLRLIRVILPNGRIEVLATSLLDQAAYPAGDFGLLYRSRWCIEEAFKTLKHRLHIEGFTGELPHAIEQDIHAKMLVANITAALCQVAHELLPEAKAARYHINQTIAIKHWPALVVTWLRDGADQLLSQLHQLVTLLTVSLNKYRPDRSCPRNFSIRGARPPRRAYH
jgi:Transposase DDE domain